jgi:hypothetical protein
MMPVEEPTPGNRRKPKTILVGSFLRLKTFCKSILVSHYDESMSVYVIGNPVPTPEEMGRILGLSPERVEAVRRIMNTPSRRKTSKSKSRITSSFETKRSGSRTPSKSRVR